MNKKIVLNNYNKIPQIGLGTWRINGKEKVRETLKTAINLGYRHIDTAWCYENEADIGEALQEIFKDVKREEIFITSKLWNSFHERPEEGLKQTLTDLKLDYLDLYLIHWPVNFQYDEQGQTKRDKDGNPLLNEFDILKLWKKMESFVKQGLVKSIGWSNFGIENVKKVLDICSIRPAMAQFEMHPYLKQKELIKLCNENDIAVTSYSSLGSQPANDTTPILKNDPVINSICKKRNATFSQVILSWITMQDIVVIPKSTSMNHLKENLELIELTVDEFEAINNIDVEIRYVDPVSFGKDRFK